MEVIYFIAFAFVSAYLFAKVEIAVEGPYGWAEKLPTWRLSKNSFINKFFFGGRIATGYHIWIIMFLLFFIHFVYLIAPFSISSELKIIATLILFWLIEDFLWFVINPAFGLKNFKKDKIWWHKDTWLWIAPRDYFIFLPISVFLYLLSFI